MILVVLVIHFVFISLVRFHFGNKEMCEVVNDVTHPCDIADDDDDVTHR